MENMENTDSDFLSLSFVDETLHANSSPNDCTNMILDTDDCQNIGVITPLNDLLLGQAFIIETDESPLFVDGAQLITFQNVDPDGQINDVIQTITTTDAEKSMVPDINFAIDHFQDLYPDFIKPDENLMKTANDDVNLEEIVDDLNNTDIDITGENYCNSTALRILSDIAKVPTDPNGQFVCDLCLSEFHNWPFYKKHRLEHLNDKPFNCLKCFKSFNYNNNYLLHIASHSTNNLKCPQCKKEFKRSASFKSHLKVHKTDESIMCNICFEIFDNQYRLDIHKEQCNQARIHSENSTEFTSVDCFQVCKTCEKSFLTVSEYQMHIKEHKMFDSVLKKQCKRSIKFKKISQTENVVKKFKCDHCDWSFSKSNMLRRHMRTHTGEKPFECSYCSKLFTQHNSLNRHLLKHKGLRPFKCELCEMNFSQKVHLINHMKRCHAVTKEATRVHQCSMCTCVYNSLNALNKHLNLHHGLKAKKSNKNVQNHEPKSIETKNINETTIHLIKDSSKLEKWLEEVANELQNENNDTVLKNCNNLASAQCECELNLIGDEHYENFDKGCSSFSNIKANNQIEIENSTNSLKNGENCNAPKKKQELKLIKCTENQFKNQEKEEKNYNKNISVSPNVKDIVAKSSSRKKNRVSRSDIKTTSPKKTNSKNNGMCHQTSNNTEQTFTKVEPKVLYVPNITTNVEDININDVQHPQPKVCHSCGKIFKKNADLERHERTHTGDKPYKCDEQGCDKAFATKCSLKYHAITHLGKMKRAVCSQCNGLFATTSSMKVHMRQHTGEKPFKCPVCGDAFRTSGHLHTHVLIHDRKKKWK